MDKSNEYVVKWFKLEDQSIGGQGQPLDKQVATAWAEQANREYPELYHYVEAATANDFRAGDVVLALNDDGKMQKHIFATEYKMCWLDRHGQKKEVTMPNLTERQARHTAALFAQHQGKNAWIEPVEQ